MEYFEAVVRPDSTESVTMKPGKGVSAEILLEEFEDTYTVPPEAVFQIGGRSVVFRREGSRFVSLPILTGARSLSRVQVLKGLQEGDRVALRDPRASPSFTARTPATGKAAMAPPGGSP